MKNVLFISQDAVLYGAPKSMLNIIDGLKDKVNFTILVPYEGDLVEELKKRNVRVIISRYYFEEYFLDSYKDYILFPYRMLRHYKSIFKTYKLVKIIHKKEAFHSIHSNSGVIRLGLYFSKWLKIPHVWHLREFQKEDYKINILYGLSYFKKVIKKSDKIICVSNAIRNHFELDTTANVIYNGVLQMKERKLDYAKDNYFIYASSLSVEKGIFDVLKAFNIFTKTNTTIELLICGTGNQELTNAITQYINENNLSIRIKLLGYRTDVLSLLTKAKACIMASHSEAFGRTTAEAMFMGCPIIGKATAGTLEIIESDKYGFLYNTIDELVFCMQEVTNQNSIKDINTIIDNAQERAIQLFSQEQLCDKVFAVYKQLK